MVVVAVAGGTGALGRTIVKTLTGSGSHEVFVLSREGRVNASPNKHRVAVDYENVDQIRQTLQQNEVEVVVSTLLLVDRKALNSQVNLIRGAAASGTVTKFIPSEYHLDFHKAIDGLEMLFRPFQLESERELERHPQLTWTLIRNGLFLDYLGMPSRPKPSNLMNWSIFVDLAHRKCVFPGDGTQTMIFTHSTDLAAYVERLICLPAKDWPRESLIQPNRIILRELAQIVKDITGQSFDVTYDSATAIHQGHITPLPANEELFSHPSWGALYRLVEKEAMFTLLSNGYELTGTDLGDIFPDVPITNLGDFLRQSWEMVQST